MQTKDATNWISIRFAQWSTSFFCFIFVLEETPGTQLPFDSIESSLIACPSCEDHQLGAASGTAMLPEEDMRAALRFLGFTVCQGSQYRTISCSRRHEKTEVWSQKIHQDPWSNATPNEPLQLQCTSTPNGPSNGHCCFVGKRPQKSGFIEVQVHVSPFATLCHHAHDTLRRNHNHIIFGPLGVNKLKPEMVDVNYARMYVQPFCRVFQLTEPYPCVLAQKICTARV